MRIDGIKQTLPADVVLLFWDVLEHFFGQYPKLFVRRI